jgi:hypothetical protein
MVLVDVIGTWKDPESLHSVIFLKRGEGGTFSQGKQVRSFLWSVENGTLWVDMDGDEEGGSDVRSSRYKVTGNGQRLTVDDPNFEAGGPEFKKLRIP